MPEGDHLSSNCDISKAAINYFLDLFSKEDLDVIEEEKEILDYIHHLVSAEMNEALLHPMSLTELEKVVFDMKKGKATSPDGFLIEFF